MKNKIPHVCLNPLLLFISKAKGTKTHGMLCQSVLKKGSKGTRVWWRLIRLGSELASSSEENQIKRMKGALELNVSHLPLKSVGESLNAYFWSYF